MAEITIGERIRQEREARNIERADLARLSKVGYSTLSEIERGGMKSSTKLHKIAAALGVSPSWLETGRGPKEAPEMDPDWADIKGYAQGVGLGIGVEADEWASSHKLKFRASSLARKNLNAEKLAVFYGRGDSMLPRIHPGDAILFDTTDTLVRDGNLYVIQVPSLANSEYQVKRAMVLDDEIYFAADNPAGDHDWVKPRKQHGKWGDAINVIGRVRWIGSWED